METAWLNMFRFITFFMKVGYGDQCVKCTQNPKTGDLDIEVIEDEAEKENDKEVVEA